MSTEHGQGTPSADDFDRQLRDLFSGSAGAAKFREPSAAERARNAARRRRPNRQPRRQPMSWHKSRQARKLRKPATGAGARPLRGPGRRPAMGAGPRSATQGRWWRRLVPFRRGRSGQKRPAARLERRKRLRSFAKGAAILVGFVVLLFLMHQLGFGPQ